MDSTGDPYPPPACAPPASHFTIGQIRCTRASPTVGNLLKSTVSNLRYGDRHGCTCACTNSSQNCSKARLTLNSSLRRSLGTRRPCGPSSSATIVASIAQLAQRAVGGDGECRTCCRKPTSKPSRRLKLSRRVLVGDVVNAHRPRRGFPALAAPASTCRSQEVDRDGGQA